MGGVLRRHRVLERFKRQVIRVGDFNMTLPGELQRVTGDAIPRPRRDNIPARQITMKQEKWLQMCLTHSLEASTTDSGTMVTRGLSQRPRPTTSRSRFLGNNGAEVGRSASTRLRVGQPIATRGARQSQLVGCGGRALEQEPKAARVCKTTPGRFMLEATP